VISGASTVDEAMMTGESMPVAKKAGCEVFAATMNRRAALLLRRRKLGRKRHWLRLSVWWRKPRAPRRQFNGLPIGWLRSLCRRVCHWFSDLCGLVFLCTRSQLQPGAPEFYFRPRYCLSLRLGVGDADGRDGGDRTGRGKTAS